uniref:uncharacterized protein LOC120950981 n=1 Tax=Anopheles coluzzii TaxID=1518534 RepID=UPI0020FFDB93|nr:uncharacterized protein LOC120950981 [Anopheles coluzzii]
MLDMEEIYEEEESDNESFAKEVNNETTSVKGENSEDEENGRKGDGNTKEKRSITEPKSKKSSKGIDKKLKKWGSAIMQPLSESFTFFTSGDNTASSTPTADLYCL